MITITEYKDTGVSIVTIKNILPLYRKGEEAKAVELVQFEENKFEVLVQKNMYKVGDKAYYIQPDYCLMDFPLFEDFIRPYGDESLSYLGRIEGVPRRIRSKKFNFTKLTEKENIYSNGILFPIDKVDNISEIKQNIYKYVPVEDRLPTNSSIDSKFPTGIYKTDETNILKCYDDIKFPVYLIGTEKLDGSSITIGLNGDDTFICSRNIRKEIYIKELNGTRNKLFRERTFLEKFIFWKNIVIDDYIEVVNHKDPYVFYGFELLTKLIEKDYDRTVLRGELYGGKFKGSGINKNVPTIPRINVFGIDMIDKDTGIAKKLPYNRVKAICNELDIPMVKTVFQKEFNSYEELITTCNNYFKKNKIEGIVVRNPDSTFSAKVMNFEYDSKK